MTEISYSSFTSEDWGQSAAKPANPRSGTSFVSIGIAAALAATVAVVGWHHSSFTNSTWTQIVKQPEAAGIRAPEAPVAAEVAKPEDAPRAARIDWLPDGMNRVAVARSGRVAAPSGAAPLMARLDTHPTGLREARVARSTRLALAEPALPKSLADALHAAAPETAAPDVAPSEVAAPMLASVPTPVPAPETQTEVAALTPTPLVTLPADNVPLPMPAQRPVAALASKPEVAPAARENSTVRAAASTDLPVRGPTPAPRPAAKPATPSQPMSPRYQLAYASPDTVNEGSDDGGGFFGKLFGGGKHSPHNVGAGVAVYSIKDATVYMPGGQKLEAHSGMGQMTDNPHYTKVRMHGPTPPNVYKLTMRERLFHGVEAVRMLPVNRGAMHGRDGMLAHTYMLRGRPGQSNGCVVFKNYAKFLRAFKAGKITKMVVVPTLDDLPRQMASL